MRTRFRPCWPLIFIAVLFAASVVATFVGCSMGGSTKPNGGYDPSHPDPEYDGEILFSDNFQEYEGIDPSKWVVYGEGAAIDGQYLTVTADEPWETGVESVMAFGRPPSEEFVAINVYTKFVPDSLPSVGIVHIQEQWGQDDGDSYFVRFEQDHGYRGVPRVDGVDRRDIPAVDVRSSAQGVLRLGRRADDTYPLHGHIAEVLIYRRALSRAERHHVEEYLTNKYGITKGSR